MTRTVPHQYYYNINKKAAKISDYLLYSSTLISISVLVFEIIKCNNEEFKSLLNTSLAVISILYVINEFIQAFLFHKAETVRNLDFVDNSFNTNFSEKKSEGYFSNDTIKEGVYKMGVNSFENVFYTKKVTGKMLTFEIIKSIVIFVLLLLVCFFANKEIVSCFFQLALPFVIIVQTSKLYFLNLKASEIFFNYKSIFSKSKNEIVDAEIIRNVINYEKVLSWAGIQTDDTIFNQMNNELIVEWNEIKKTHSIEA